MEEDFRSLACFTNFVLIDAQITDTVVVASPETKPKGVVLEGVVFVGVGAVLEEEPCCFTKVDIIE